MSWVNSLDKKTKKIFIEKLDKVLGNEKKTFKIPYETVLIITKK